MVYAVSLGGGLCMSPVDVCMMPTPAGPIPTPYPNTGSPSMGVPPVANVLIAGSPALNMSSKIPLTNGDEAGTAGGVQSGMIMGPVDFIQGSSKVLIGGSPAVRLTSQTMQNQNNAVGTVLAPSQTVVMVMS